MHLPVARSPVAHLLLLLAIVAVGTACDDDGATTRDAGSVEIIGPPPPAGGGSVSAIGTGCTTRGATTKVPVANLEVGLDEWSVAPPTDVAAGVNRFVVKNFGAQAHSLAITPAASIADLPTVDGQVDQDNLGSLFTIAEFPRNTICEGTFELPAASYVMFCTLVGADGTSHFTQGMAAAFVVT